MDRQESIRLWNRLNRNDIVSLNEFFNFINTILMYPFSGERIQHGTFFIDDPQFIFSFNWLDTGNGNEAGNGLDFYKFNDMTQYFHRDFIRLVRREYDREQEPEIDFNIPPEDDDDSPEIIRRRPNIPRDDRRPVDPRPRPDDRRPNIPRPVDPRPVESVQKVNRNTVVAAGITFGTLSDHFRIHTPREIATALGREEANRLLNPDNNAACNEIHRTVRTVLNRDAGIADLIRISQNARTPSNREIFQTFQQHITEGIDMYVSGNYGSQVQHPRENLMRLTEHLLRSNNEGLEGVMDNQIAMIQGNPDLRLGRFMFLTNTFLSRLREFGRAGKILHWTYVLAYLNLGVSGYGHTIETFNRSIVNGRPNAVPGGFGLITGCAAGNSDRVLLSLKPGIEHGLRLIATDPVINRPEPRPDVQPVVRPDVRPNVRPDVRPAVRPAVQPDVDNGELLDELTRLMDNGMDYDMAINQATDNIRRRGARPNPRPNARPDAAINHEELMTELNRLMNSGMDYDMAFNQATDNVRQRVQPVVQPAVQLNVPDNYDGELMVELQRLLNTGIQYEAAFDQATEILRQRYQNPNANANANANQNANANANQNANALVVNDIEIILELQRLLDTGVEYEPALVQATEIVRRRYQNPNPNPNVVQPAVQPVVQPVVQPGAPACFPQFNNTMQPTRQSMTTLTNILNDYRTQPAGKSLNGFKRFLCEVAQEDSRIIDPVDVFLQKMATELYHPDNNWSGGLHFVDDNDMENPNSEVWRIVATQGGKKKKRNTKKTKKNKK